MYCIERFLKIIHYYSHVSSGLANFSILKLAYAMLMS